MFVLISHSSELFSFYAISTRKVIDFHSTVTRKVLLVKIHEERLVTAPLNKKPHFEKILKKLFVFN